MPTPVYQLAFGEKQQFEDVNGNPLAGAKLFVYTAGTSTKATSYQETDGVSANTNPIILDGTGALPKGVYVQTGLFKLVLAPSTDSDPPLSPIWTRDQITPINDTNQVFSEWIGAAGGTPTWLSATTFSVIGDQTPTFIVGRRIRVIDSGGTKYAYITVASFGAGITTVTVLLDTGVLANPISSTSLGILTPINPSLPLALDTFPILSGSADNSKKLRLEVDTNVVTATTRVLTVPSADGTIALQIETQDSYMLQNATLTASVASNILTVALKDTSGSDCSASSPASIAFRSTTATVGTFSVRTVTAALSMTVSAGSTLGLVNSESGRVHVGLIDNAGTVEMCVWRALSGLDVVSFTEWTVQTTTAEGGAGAADSAATLYSTTARSNVAFRYLGSVDIQYGTAQWSNSPTRVQTATRNSPRPGDIITSRVSFTGAGVSSAGALGSGTTQIPLDDTIPTSTEGDEYLILNHAPISAVNLLRINWSLYVASASPATTMTAFLNKDAGAAVSAVSDFGDNGAGNAPRSIFGDYSAVAGGTSSSAWRVRAGPGSAATMYVNGAGAARRFGGACLSNVRLEEIFA